eukprot:1679963-Pyramimonas_sp.AAC.1
MALALMVSILSWNSVVAVWSAAKWCDAGVQDTTPMTAQIASRRSCVASGTRSKSSSAASKVDSKD